MKFKICQKLYSSKNIKFVEKKKKIYLRQITELLNATHKTNNTESYWLVIIDYWLSYFLFYIKYKINTLSITNDVNPVYLKKNGIIFNTTEDLLKSLNYSRDLDSYVNNILLNKNNSNNKFLKKINLSSVKKKIFYIKDFYYNFLFALIRKLISLYIFINKPIVIVEGYFGYKNSLKIFAMSFGKILIIPRKFLFDNKINDCSIDYSLRNKIKVEEKDLFDQVFNNLLKNFLPKSFLENYSVIKNSFLFYCNNISKSGTASLHYFNDNFSIFLAEFKKKKKKIYIFQHGAYYKLVKYNLREIIDKKYSKTYYWNNQKGLGFNYLSRFKKIESKNLINNKKIFYFLGYTPKEFDNVLIDQKYNTLNLYGTTAIKIFKNLNSELKSKYYFRFFKHSTNVDISNNINKVVYSRIKKYSISVDRNISSKKSFNESRVVIMDNFSTAFYECIYIGIPVIVIADINKFNFKSSFKKILFKLKNKGMIYDNAETVANFLNKNYNTLFKWWNDLYFSQLMKELKFFLFKEDKNFCKKITFELKKKNPLKYTKKIF